MIVNLRLFPEGGLTVEGEEDPAIVDLDDPLTDFRRPIAYRLRVVRTGRHLLVRGTLETEALLTCSRCLKIFSFPVRAAAFAREIEIGDNQEKIDLTGDIREDIILAIPAKPLCRAACRGLCPLCGQELNAGDCGCRDPESDTPFAELDQLLGNNQKG
jgi:uncharacterized protein